MTDTKPKTSLLPSGGNASRKGSVPLDSSLNREPRSFLSFKQFLHFLNLSCRTIDLSRKDLFDVLLLECCERGELAWQSPGTLRRVAGCLGVKEGDARRLVQGMVLGGPHGEDGEAARRALRLVDESCLFEWDAATSTFLARAGASARPPEARLSPSASDASSDSEPRASRGLDSRRKISITRRELPGRAPQRPCSLERAVKQKLGEVIQEGLLDSVLPYVVPKEVAPPRGHAAPAQHRRPSCTRTDKSASQGQDDAGSTQLEPDCEVVIYVSDEVKNLKREYKCSQRLLVSKMGYFAEVTTGQKLEDMDISVHCDMDTFDWLMRWIKKDSLPSSEWPSLDPGNVLPVLVSAAFLQMDPLLAACLRFCHDRMDEVVDTSDTIGGLNDNNVVRLSEMFSNEEVERLDDRRDRIKSRLYTRLVVALVEGGRAPGRGHYGGLRGVWRCARCEQLVPAGHGGLARRLPCRPESTWLGRAGDVLSFHDRDTKWSLEDHIVGLLEATRSWREVYWRLWGQCHFLQCGACRTLFPACHAQCCRYHREPPQFFTMEHQRAATFPVGRHPCCGAKALRFDPLDSCPGCQFREHEPELDAPDSVEVFKIFKKYEKLIAAPCPVQSADGHKLSLQFRPRDECPWRTGLARSLPPSKDGLVPKIWEAHPAEATFPRTASPTKSGSTCQDARRPAPRVPLRASAGISDDDESSSDESPSSEEWSPAPGEAARARRLAHGAARWSPRLTTRTNQDHQRCHEEDATRRLVECLTRRAAADCSRVHGPARTGPPGGTYIRLEQEWRAANSYLFLGSNRRAAGSAVTARPRLRARQ